MNKHIDTIINALCLALIAAGVALATASAFYLASLTYINFKNAGVQKSSVDARFQIGTKR